MPTTIAEALRSAAARLAESPTPAADAEELLGRLLGLRRAELHLQGGRALTAGEQATWESWLSRRSRGEPVQHVTGRAAFRDLDLAVGPGVLIPRPETEGLVEAVLEVLRQTRSAWPAPRVLDLGTGSGAIALSIAREWPEAEVTATDRSAEALRIARGNALALGLEGRVRFLEGHWFEAVAADERFEVVVANPPYIATTERESLPPDVREHEPPGALFSGPLGTEDLREIVERAPLHLAGGGLLALELAEARAEEVAGWLEGSRDWEGIRLLDDLAGRPRVLLARRQRGPAIAPAQWEEERSR